MNIGKVVNFILYLPWILAVPLVGLIGWWLVEPVPLRVTYTAPFFARTYAYDKDDAEKYAIQQTLGGNTVYLYVEFCIDKPFKGVSERKWVSEALVWEAPSVATSSSSETGCFKRSVPVLTPTSNPSRTFHFHQVIYADTNPIRTDAVHYTPIPLRLLSAQDFMGSE